MVLLHPDRYTTKNVVLKKKGVVVHDSESPDGSAVNLLHFLQQPGDRTTSSGGKYGSGYHAVTTGDDNYVEVADASCGPYAGPPTNETWWHICMPGRAAQTRAEWLDDLSRKHIRGVAKFIVAKAKVDGFNLWKITPSQMQLGQGGYCSHWDVSLAWKRSTHTDPGANFPWDVLWGDIQELIKPVEEEDDMGKLVRYTDDAAVFIKNGNEVVWAINQETINAAYVDGDIDRNSPKEISPLTRKTHVLVGREPDYTGVGDPHRLTGADFARWEKP